MFAIVLHPFYGVVLTKVGRNQFLHVRFLVHIANMQKHERGHAGMCCFALMSTCAGYGSKCSLKALFITGDVESALYDTLKTELIKP